MNIITSVTTRCCRNDKPYSSRAILGIKVMSAGSHSTEPSCSAVSQRAASCSTRLGVNMFLFVRKNKDDKESKEFYYLGRIRHNAGGILKEFVMQNTDATAVEIEYKLDTPVEKNLYDYITSANV